jgi:ABC-type polysaccharide/polyol phosphate export permease
MTTRESAIDAHDTTRETAFRSSATRPGSIGLILEGWREIWWRRRLIGYLARADLKKKGADTLFGNLWWIIDPLLQMAVYVVLVDFIFHKSQADYPLFIFCAILPWKWFTSSVNDASSAVVGQGQLIKQIQFPKIVLPMASTAAAVVGFAFGLIPLFAIMLLYPHRLSPYLALIPVIAAVQFLFTLGIAFFVAGVNVFFRDLGNVLRHFLRLWFYLSPGLYSLDTFDSSPAFRDHPTLLNVVHANPFATLFESYRAVIYGEPFGGPHMPDWIALGTLALGSLVLIAIGAIVFKRLEPMYAKVL